MSARPAIPDGILREVRKRCHFGCVICGIPIFEYDHIDEYAQEQTHEAANLTLLCELHHGQKTKGRLSKSVLIAANSNPFNKGKDFTSPGEVSRLGLQNLRFDTGAGVVRYALADGHFMHMLNIDFTHIVTARREENSILLSLKIFDSHKQLLLNVDRGEIRYSLKVFDFELVGQRLTIRSALRKLEYVLCFSSDGFAIEKGIFYGSFGTSVEFGRGALLVRGSSFTKTLRVSDSVNRCIAALPDYASVEETDISGNVISRSFLRRLKNNKEKFQRDVGDDYATILLLYGNTLNAVCARYPYRRFKTELIEISREARALYREKGWEESYVTTSRVLARALWRFHPEQLCSLIESVSILYSILDHEYIVARPYELARVQKSLADSLLTLNNRFKCINQLYAALELYDRAEVFYAKMFQYSNSNIDVEAINHARSIVKRLLALEPQ